MGKTEKRELVSRLTVLLLPSPEMAALSRPGAAIRGGSRSPMRATRSPTILEDNPSLKAVLDSCDGASLPIGAPEGGD